MRHVVKLLEEPVAIPAEEIGIGLQDERDVEQGDASVLQSPHIVDPKLIFEEESGHKMATSHPLCGMVRRIGGQINDLIGYRVVFADFITRGREKRQQDFILRKLLFYRFDDRTPLLKLTKGSSMEPDPIIHWPFGRLWGLSIRRSLSPSKHRH